MKCAKIKGYAAEETNKMELKIFAQKVSYSNIIVRTVILIIFLSTFYTLFIYFSMTIDLDS